MSQDSALLDAAVEQFVLTGVRRTSADDIARRAGVNRATLYRRLGTKDQIVSQAILQETGRVLARIAEAIGDVPPPGTAGFDPAAYVLTFFSVTIGEVKDNQLLQQLMVKDREDTLIGLTARRRRRDRAGRRAVGRPHPPSSAPTSATRTPSDVARPPGRPSRGSPSRCC